MKRIVLAALTLPVFLVGCGSAVEEDGTYNDQDSKVYGVIKKVDVDGTTCIVFDAEAGGGALSCDWAGSENEEEVTE